MDFAIVKWLMLLPVVMMYKQNQYTLKFERAHLVNFNKDLYNSVKFKTFKYNRTQACTNFTADLKIAFGNEAQIEIQAYKFASNEYRLFPLRFAFNFCQFAKNDEFGLRAMFKCGNVTGCPLQKRVYHFCNFFPDAHRFPPYIPSGSYMVDVKLFYPSTEAVFIQGFGIIDYPIAIE